MTTVVTGASGFIGAILVRRLLQDGRPVRAVDIERGPGLLGLDVEFVSADVRDRASLDEAFSGAEIVYHLAAAISVTGDRDGTVWATNVDGARHVAEAALAASVTRLVHCSSVHAYDLEAAAVVNEHATRSVNHRLPVYDRSKARGEGAVRTVIERGLDAVIVNPTGVIGPGDHARSRMNEVLLAMLRGRFPAVVEGGFDWVDVRDVVAAMTTAEKRGRRGENYLLPGHIASLARLAELTARAAGHGRSARRVPWAMARLVAPLTTPVARRLGNPLWPTTEALHAIRFGRPVTGTKAWAELDHQPRPIESTIADLRQWFIDQGRLAPA